MTKSISLTASLGLAILPLLLLVTGSQPIHFVLHAFGL
ncbi:MAG: hypothetical protein JWM33_3949 [Caulobacteraceae bacterium]|nr:hypothetical protein [Caulobacteraceae bacterium]